MSDACGGADSLVLDNIVYYADPHMRTTMLSKLDIHRIDYLRQAEELAQFAQSTEIDTHARNLVRDVVNAVEQRKVPKEIATTKVKDIFPDGDNRTCYKCGEVGTSSRGALNRRRKSHNLPSRLVIVVVFKTTIGFLTAGPADIKSMT